MQGISRFSVVTQVRPADSTSVGDFRFDDALPAVSVCADNLTQARDRFLLNPANAVVAEGVTKGTHRVGAVAQRDVTFP